MLDSTTYRLTLDREWTAAATPAGLAAVQHAISAGLIWDLRVLAGWLPGGGVQLMRVLAGWFEIANVAELLAELDGRGHGSYFELGSLATAWSRSRHARSPAELRSTLASSAWKDPGGEAAEDIAVGLRARWAERVAALGEPARSWAAGALALLLAAERFDGGRTGHKVLGSVAISLLGPAAAAAGTIDELASALPAKVSWVLASRTSAADLWRNAADAAEPGSQVASASGAAVLCASEPDIAALAGQGRDDLIAGEKQLRQHGMLPELCCGIRRTAWRAGCQPISLRRSGRRWLVSGARLSRCAARAEPMCRR